MNSQLFLLLNIIIGALFLIWFLSGRKGGGGKPTRLDLSKGNQFTNKAERSAATRTNQQVAPHFEHHDSQNSPQPKIESVNHRIQNAKNLNVMFIYNGHSWDAYEVLGAPAGLNITALTAHYQNLIKNADHGQLEFYETAYQAILKKM